MITNGFPPTWGVGSFGLMLGSRVAVAAPERAVSSVSRARAMEEQGRGVQSVAWCLQAFQPLRSRVHRQARAAS